MSGAPLLDAVTRLAVGSPYQVTPTERGFDLVPDVQNRVWHSALRTVGRSSLFVHHVSVSGGTYTIADDLRQLTWVAGLPTLGVQASRSQGRLVRKSVRKTWGRDQAGDWKAAPAEHFDSDEGRDLVTTAAKQLGLTQRRGTAERIGLVAAVVGGLGAVVTAVLLLVFWLLGMF